MRVRTRTSAMAPILWHYIDRLRHGGGCGIRRRLGGKRRRPVYRRGDDIRWDRVLCPQCHGAPGFLCLHLGMRQHRGTTHDGGGDEAGGSTLFPRTRRAEAHFDSN